jgi:hypothetical protein
MRHMVKYQVNRDITSFERSMCTVKFLKKKSLIKQCSSLITVVIICLHFFLQDLKTEIGVYDCEHG